MSTKTNWSKSGAKPTQRVNSHKMQTMWKLLGGCLVALILYGCNQLSQSDTASLSSGRPFITKWKGTAGQELKIPILGTYTLTWYNEATPNERHTEQVTVTTSVNDLGEGITLPYSFTPPTDGVYVVEAGPEGVEGMLMWFDKSNKFAKTLLSVVRFGDVVWKRLDSAFYWCYFMKFDSEIDTPNLSQCTSLEATFAGCKLFDAPLGHWDVSNVTNMERMFYGCAAFNQNISGWNVSNVSNMKALFASCDSFNQPLENWDVSNVTNMEEMFANSFHFNQPLERWDVSRVSNMSKMFWGCRKFNQPLNSWNVGKVEDMSCLFNECYEFNQPLDKWDVSQVTNTCSMFADCYKFNQPLNSWNVSNVEWMRLMFQNCVAFKQSLDAWDISKASSKNGSFEACPAAKLPFLKKWKAQYGDFDDQSAEYD